MSDASFKDLYASISPNFKTSRGGIRILFFFLTTMSLYGAGFLFGIFFSLGSYKTLLGFIFFFGLAAIALAEFYIHNSKAIRTGIDDALLSWGMALAVWACCLFLDYSSKTEFWVKLALFTHALFSILAFVRYKNRLYLVQSLLMLAALSYWITHDASSVIANLTPLIIAMLYFIGSLVCSKKCRFLYQQQQAQFFNYIFSLLVYLASYGLGLSLSYSLFSSGYNLDSQIKQITIVDSILYWSGWVVPVVLLATGIGFKKKWAIDAGIISLLTTLFTYKVYLHIPSTTWDAFSFGLMLITVGGGFMLFFSKKPHKTFKGFTSRPLLEADEDNIDWINLSSVVLAPTVSGPAAADKPLGQGGHYGGGGASGDF